MDERSDEKNQNYQIKIKIKNRFRFDALPKHRCGALPPEMIPRKLAARNLACPQIPIWDRFGMPFDHPQLHNSQKPKQIK